MRVQTDPQLWAVDADSRFDSFITVGLEAALIDGAMGSVGIDFSGWSETAGFTTQNGAVYIIDPAQGATTIPCPIAMLTVRTGSMFNGRVNAQGQTSQCNAQGQCGQWVARDLEFSEGGGADSGH